MQLTSAAPRQLTFSWDPVAPNCAAIHYNILAQNCGICPSATQHNTVVCHDMEVDQNLTCSFVVQNFRTCDGVAGRMSIPVSIMLKGNNIIIADDYQKLYSNCYFRRYSFLACWNVLIIITILLTT